MRNGFFYSLLFALLTSASIATVAAPFAVPQTEKAAMVTEASDTLPTSEKVDLNGADADTLQKQLSGVGAAKAKAIIAYRDANGPFASVDELLEVKGIGKAILDRNRDKLEVN
ncbi:helix-hairpin-helix domain-containing protein [Pseudomonas sp. HS6]|uniref:ComEA family DNA-binding protein n=1 Tax=Pseudomonas sp. HS6 TaxID=2850559 RepID=UPI0020193675|nr:helix-hairpin-helix domain-containing protein [Pseudomonas sp. HS6]UQS13066.1 helix-hairpin-helix domain-containing protein [Pseudomonas sp. HS6]